MSIGKAGFRVGASQTDITPLRPMVLIGMGGRFEAREGREFDDHARNRTAHDAFDPLTLHALWLEDGSDAAVLLTTDLLYPEAEDEVRAAVADACGLPSEAVFYTATHNHNGPCRTDEYAALLCERASACAREAKERAGPARLKTARTRWTPLIFNRSAPWDGVKGDVGVVCFLDSRSDQPIAMLWNYGCHPCSLSPEFNQFCADYPGALRRSVYQTLGTTFPILFLTDCSGNVQPIGLERFHEPRHMYLTVRKGDVVMMERFGESLAQVGLAALQAETTSTTPERLMARRFSIRLPVDIVDSLEELQQRKAHPEDALPGPDIPENEPLRAELRRVLGAWTDDIIECVKKGESARQAGAGIVSFGGLAVVMLPLEPCWEIGDEIRRRAPFDDTLIATTSLGYEGYLANEKAYALPRGDRPYEASVFVHQAGFSYCGATVRSVVDTVLDELHNCAVELSPF